MTYSQAAHFFSFCDGFSASPHQLQRLRSVGTFNPSDWMSMAKDSWTAAFVKLKVQRVGNQAKRYDDRRPVTSPHYYLRSYVGSL